jgi:hypothetical protein
MRSLPAEKTIRRQKLDRKSCLAAVALIAAAGSLLVADVRALDAEPPYPALIMPEPISNNDPTFESIFDGKTLQGWKGDPTCWRVENGTIVGESTQKESSTNYLVWQVGRPADFELMLDYRISSMGNSGVQYRSTEIPGVKGALRGYQADIDGAGWGKKFFGEFALAKGSNLKRVTGQNFEEWGRTFLALPGQLSYVGNGTKQRVLASLGDPDILRHALREGWNTIHLIVRGNQMIHIVNNRIMSIVIDDDTDNRRMDGLLALQVHGGDPMKVEFRNILLKPL